MDVLQKHPTFLYSKEKNKIGGYYHHENSSHLRQVFQRTANGTIH